MLFSSLFEKEEKVSLLIDIGSGSVTGALVLFGKKIKPTALYSVTFPFSVGVKPDNDKLLNSMVTLLDNVMSSITKKGLAVPYWKNKSKKIYSILISFSSPWFASKTKNIHLEEKIPFNVTHTFMENILDIEGKTFEKELLDSNYENIFSGEMIVVEKEIIDTKINGYSISNSLDRKTKKLETSLYLSLISKMIVDSVCSQILKHVHIPKENIHIHTFPFISFTVVKSLFPKIEDFLFFDVTAEVTDVTSVHLKSILETRSFPFGRNFIIRQISKKFNVTSEIAESYLHIYNSKIAGSDIVSDVESVISLIEKEWAVYFEDMFIQLSKNTILPPRIFITSEGDITGILQNFIKSPKEEKDITSIFRKGVEIININAKLLSNVYKSDLYPVSDEFVGMLSAFYDKSINIEIQ